MPCSSYNYLADEVKTNLYFLTVLLFVVNSVGFCVISVLDQVGLRLI